MVLLHGGYPDNLADKAKGLGIPLMDNRRRTKQPTRAIFSELLR